MTDKDLIIQRLSYNCSVCDLPISCPALCREALFKSIERYWNDPDIPDHKISLYKARKIVHELENNGFIVKDYYGGQTDEGYPFCVHGYRLTDLGKNELEIYKKVDDQLTEEFNQQMEELLGDDIPW